MTEVFRARVTTRSARATRELGARLGRLLGPGDVVALEGELGTGKTELVRGACSGADVPEADVSSPSFAIVATYRGRLPVHHADLYRISGEDELYGTGFDDLVGGEGALLVEWAERVPSALPAERLTIRLAHAPRQPNTRHLEIEGVGERHARLARALMSPSSLSPAPAEERAGVRGKKRSGSRSGRPIPPSPPHPQGRRSGRPITPSPPHPRGRGSG